MKTYFFGTVGILLFTFSCSFNTSLNQGLYSLRDSSVLPDAAGNQTGVSDANQDFPSSATVPDAALDVLGQVDSAKPEARISDISFKDINIPDVGKNDIGLLDVGLKDLGLKDVGLLDVGLKDVGLKDVGLRDVGLKDIGLKDTLPGPVTLSFDNSIWSLYRRNLSNNNYPIVSADKTQISLLPENEADASVAAIYYQDLAPPYAVEFEFSIYSGDGEPNNVTSTKTADGIAFFCGIKRSSYSNSTLPTKGINAGFIADYGYSVHLVVYEHRGVTVNASPLNIVSSNYASKGSDLLADVYTGNNVWKKLRVEVRTSGIKVFFEGTQVINYQNSLTFTYNGMGFGAGSGSATDNAKVRNFVLYKLAN